MLHNQIYNYLVKGTMKFPILNQVIKDNSDLPMPF